jgi:hypothetical protein
MPIVVDLAYAKRLADHAQDRRTFIFRKFVQPLSRQAHYSNASTHNYIVAMTVFGHGPLFRSDRFDQFGHASVARRHPVRMRLATIPRKIVFILVMIVDIRRPDAIV